MNIFWKAITIYIKKNAFAVGSKVSVALFLVISAMILAGIFGRIVRKTVESGQARAFAPMLGTLTRVATLIFGIVMAFDHMGVQIKALLAGAGVVGLAIGFGAQTLVKDCISGFFLIFDNVLQPGDYVDVNGKCGYVDQIDLRLTSVRAVDGVLWHIPNGSIQIVGNYHREWIRAIVEIGLAYEEDTTQGMALLKQVGESWAKEHADIVVEPPEVQGLLTIGSAKVTARLLVKLKANTASQGQCERQLRTLIKQEFEQAKLKII
jgi:moderate conductance mechanosensitive channel